MLKGKVDNVRQALVNVSKQPDKKTIENLVIMAVILVITIIAINYIWKDDKKNNTENKNTMQINNQENNMYEAGNNNNKERPIFFPIHLHSIFDMVAVSRGLGKRTVWIALY